jgi:hypothetical protein
MATQNRESSKTTAFLDPGQELMQALFPLRRITWVNHFIKKVKQPGMAIPKTKNENTEKFLLGLALCLCLFMKNQSSLIKYGKLLKMYTAKYAKQVPVEEAPFIVSKLNELIQRTKIK